MLDGIIEQEGRLERLTIAKTFVSAPAGNSIVVQYTPGAEPQPGASILVLMNKKNGGHANATKIHFRSKQAACRERVRVKMKVSTVHRHNIIAVRCRCSLRICITHIELSMPRRIRALEIAKIS